MEVFWETNAVYVKSLDELGQRIVFARDGLTNQTVNLEASLIGVYTLRLYTFVFVFVFVNKMFPKPKILHPGRRGEGVGERGEGVGDHEVGVVAAEVALSQLISTFYLIILSQLYRNVLSQRYLKVLSQLYLNFLSQLYHNILSQP